MSDINGRTDDDDIFTLSMMAFGSIGLIASAGGAIALSYWHQSVRWMIHHDVLVPRRHQPLLEVPYGRGAGLDLPRLILITAVLLALLALAVHAVRRRLAARRDEQR